MARDRIDAPQLPFLSVLRRTGILTLLGTLLFSSGCDPAHPPVRNVVLISIDTLVPGRMSVYGGPRPTTPAIANLAARGVRFDHALSPAPWTLPAHAAMLTGRYPSSLAVDPVDRRLYRLAPMLAERFGQAGYRTGAVLGGGFVSSALGIARGFDEIHEPPPTMAGGAFAERGNQHAVDWIGRLDEERFFLFYHTFVVHEPYRDNRFVGPRLNRRVAELSVTDMCCKPQDLNQRQIDQMLSIYDGGVAAADEFVESILQALSKAGLRESTAIIITSDHGQEFWSHTKRGGHSHSLYANQLEIPLIWYEPGLAESGRVVQQPVNLVDIVPTLVARFNLDADGDLARLEDASSADSDSDFDGMDISPLLEGRSWNVDRAFFGEAVENGPKRYSVSTSRAKLILTPQPKIQYGRFGKQYPVPVRAMRELYLAEDRREGDNVISDPRLAAILEEHARLLESHRAGAETRESDVSSPVFTEALKRQLRELGYAE